jgi:DNA-binding MarR family transcriptional regulator
MPTRRKPQSDARSGPPELGCACATVRRVARQITKLYDQQLRAAEIEAPQYALLTTLKRHGPCSQAALGRPHGLDKTTMSRNLRVLERNGWIAFVPTADRRERHVVLTPAGERQQARAAVRWKAAQSGLRAAMSDDEWTAMFAAFAAVSRAADRAAAKRRG